MQLYVRMYIYINICEVAIASLLLTSTAWHPSTPWDAVKSPSLKYSEKSAAPGTRQKLVGGFNPSEKY